VVQWSVVGEDALSESDRAMNLEKWRRGRGLSYLVADRFAADWLGSLLILLRPQWDGRSGKGADPHCLEPGPDNGLAGLGLARTDRG